MHVNSSSRIWIKMTTDCGTNNNDKRSHIRQRLPLIFRFTNEINWWHRIESCCGTCHNKRMTTNQVCMTNLLFIRLIRLQHWLCVRAFYPMRHTRHLKRSTSSTVFFLFFSSVFVMKQLTFNRTQHWLAFNSKTVMWHRAYQTKMSLVIRIWLHGRQPPHRIGEFGPPHGCRWSHGECEIFASVRVAFVFECDGYRQWKMLN